MTFSQMAKSSGQVKWPSQMAKSRDVQSNGQIFFSRLFTHFQDNSQKLSRIKSVCIISVLKFMDRALKGPEICSFPGIFKFMCAKRKHKAKRDNSPG